MVIEQVQLADIEDATYVPAGYDIVGKQVSNWLWRSPEADTQGRNNKSSDMFSFCVVVSRQGHCSPWSLRVTVYFADERRTQWALEASWRYSLV
jgi:hypothetical protein